MTQAPNQIMPPDSTEEKQVLEAVRRLLYYVELATEAEEEEAAADAAAVAAATAEASLPALFGLEGPGLLLAPPPAQAELEAEAAAAVALAAADDILDDLDSLMRDLRDVDSELLSSAQTFEPGSLRLLGVRRAGRARGVGMPGPAGEAVVAVGFGGGEGVCIWGLEVGCPPCHGLDGAPRCPQQRRSPGSSLHARTSTPFLPH